MAEFVNATPALEALIDPVAEFKLLGSGYLFTEGPAWNHHEGYLEFSDIPGDAVLALERGTRGRARHAPELQGQRHGLRT